MDPSWHHHAPPPPPLPIGGAPPPQAATICPVCSMYHFPFCPPPPPLPPFSQNIHPIPHQYPPPPPPPDQFYHPRPPQHPPPLPPAPPPSAYDPFVDHQSGPAANPRQQPPWIPSSGFDKDPDGNMYANSHSTYAGAKRMRFDDSGFSPSPAHPSVAAEDERRLKLIRDHGGAMSGESRNSATNLGTSNSFDPGYCDYVPKSNFGHDIDRSSLHQNNVYEYSRRSLNSMEQLRQNQERMGFNRHGVSGDQYGNKQNVSLPNQNGQNIGLTQNYRVFSSQPPLPVSPPPPLPVDPPGQHMVRPVVSSSPSGTSPSLFPVAPGSSTGVQSSSYHPVPELSLLAAHQPIRGNLHASTSFGSEDLQGIRQAPYKAYFGRSEVIPQQPLSPNKPKVVDATHIIKQPHRVNRPDHIVIILRGLPGSGKSYLAKMLRDLEVENGGNVPRIHSMDDYFMTEVEKVEESEFPKPSGSARGKRPVMKKVIEFCYEPEMEEAYRSSMLKAFKKTLDEGVFPFVIVDDRNLRVADFAQFWATAKRSGYEVYLLEATYKDPAGCAARNVHGFTQEDIQKMADLWEEAPTLYLKLDIKVDMDMEDGDPVGLLSGSEERNVEKLVISQEGDLVGSLKEDQRGDAEADHPIEEVKELGKSKWSNNLDEDDNHKNEDTRNLNSLSGLRKSYSKEGKSVRWGDQVRNSGFSIAVAKFRNIASLVIGPGAGYNMKSNPLPDEELTTASHGKGKLRKQSVFQEQLRAEQESFKAVFDKRRQRISMLDED
ncbi:uncharacterized protein [Coffea arabica]|uniref:Uncharacterized protein isoform X2 n=1 Tax=Coffea arabica TaxID=13443 RepID=A0ABM4U591_COFAR